MNTTSPTLWPEQPSWFVGFHGGQGIGSSVDHSWPTRVSKVDLIGCIAKIINHGSQYGVQGLEGWNLRLIEEAGDTHLWIWDHRGVVVKDVDIEVKITPANPFFTLAFGVAEDFECIEYLGPHVWELDGAVHGLSQVVHPSQSSNGM